ncbi:MAG: hypothetical protein ABI255_09345 [Microbacteriaceae bacterium]
MVPWNIRFGASSSSNASSRMTTGSLPPSSSILPLATIEPDIEVGAELKVVWGKNS